jgi:hypothetical protein
LCIEEEKTGVELLSFVVVVSDVTAIILPSYKYVNQAREEKRGYSQCFVIGYGWLYDFAK